MSGTCAVCGRPIAGGNAVRPWFHEDGVPEDYPDHEATPATGEEVP